MTFFDHPLHPMAVHFPIALYLLGVLLTLVYLWRKNPEIERFAYWCFLLSGLGAVVASLVGLIDQSRLDLNDPRRANVNSHITAGVALIIINGLLVYMRFRWPDVLTRYQWVTRYRWVYLGLMAAGVIIVFITAWLGAELVYRWQIGVIQ